MSDERLRRLSRADVREALDGRSSDDRSDPDRRRTDPTVAGVLLAAGGSSRFGAENKLLAETDGEPLVRHAARTLRDARVSPVVVVVGHEADAVRDALGGLDGWDESSPRFVTNRAYERGLSSSVRAGVDAAGDASADATVFLLGDMPSVDPATVDLLVDAYRAGLAEAVAPEYRDQRGNPVLFDREHFAALRAVEGDVGGRSVLLGSDRGAMVETDDPGVVRDIDTREDLESYR